MILIEEPVLHLNKNGQYQKHNMNERSITELTRKQPTGLTAYFTPRPQLPHANYMIRHLALNFLRFQRSRQDKLPKLAKKISLHSVFGVFSRLTHLHCFCKLPRKLCMVPLKTGEFASAQ